MVEQLGLVGAAFARANRSRGLSPRTLEFYEWALAKLPSCDGGWPTSIELEQALGELVVGSESRWDVWRAWRRFFGWAERRLGLPNPWLGLDPPVRRRALPRYLTWEQIRRLLAAAPSRRDRAFMLLVLDTGLRLGEAARLQPGDVQLDVVRVLGKVGVRQLPCSPAVVRELLPHLPWRATAHGLQLAVRRAARSAGLGPVGPHALRHSFAVHYVLRGGDVFSLQRILGHSSIETTRVYVELAGSDVAAQHRRFSPALALLGVG